MPHCDEQGWPAREAEMHGQVVLGSVVEGEPEQSFAGAGLTGYLKGRGEEKQNLSPHSFYLFCLVLWLHK